MITPFTYSICTSPTHLAVWLAFSFNHNNYAQNSLSLCSRNVSVQLQYLFLNNYKQSGHPVFLWYPCQAMTDQSKDDNNFIERKKNSAFIITHQYFRTLWLSRLLSTMSGHMNYVCLNEASARLQGDISCCLSMSCLDCAEYCKAWNTFLHTSTILKKVLGWNALKAYKKRKQANVFYTLLLHKIKRIELIPQAI